MHVCNQQTSFKEYFLQHGNQSLFSKVCHFRQKFILPFRIPHGYIDSEMAREISFVKDAKVNHSKHERTQEGSLRRTDQLVRAKRKKGGPA